MNLNAVKALISATPYRTDEKGVKKAKLNCLHYDVLRNHNGSFPEMLDQIVQWLNNTKGVEKLKARSDVEFIELNMGIFIGKNNVSLSCAIPNAFLQIAGNRIVCYNVGI